MMMTAHGSGGAAARPLRALRCCCSEQCHTRSPQPSSRDPASRYNRQLVATQPRAALWIAVGAAPAASNTNAATQLPAARPRPARKSTARARLAGVGFDSVPFHHFAFCSRSSFDRPSCLKDVSCNRQLQLLFRQLLLRHTTREVGRLLFQLAHVFAARALNLLSPRGRGARTPESGNR